MISKGFRSSATWEGLLSVVSEADILEYYLGVMAPVLICSPLRPDRKPSFSIYLNRDNKTRYKDFATGEQGDLIDLLSELLGLGYYWVSGKIANDMGITEFSSNLSTRKASVIQPRKVLSIKVGKKEWDTKSLYYWSSHGVSKAWLDKANVIPIRWVRIIRDNEVQDIITDKLAFAYEESLNGVKVYKIYQPHNKRLKWFGNQSGVIPLFDKLPEYGDKLVICSSVKDALCLMSNTNLHAISLSSETARLPDRVISDLKQRFRYIYVLLDNDETGVTHGKQMAESQGLLYAELERVNNKKDIAELYMWYNDKVRFVKAIETALKTKLL